MLSQINGSAGRFLVVHTELQVHYPEIAVSPAESGRIRPSGGIRRIPADSAGNWLSYSTVNHSNLVVADVFKSKRINESQLAPKSVKQAVESGRDNAGTRDLAPQSRVSARRLFSLP